MKLQLTNSFVSFCVGAILLCQAQPCLAQDPLDFLSFELVSDANAATSEHGYADNSINNIAYITSNIQSVGGEQFIAYYGENPNDPSDPFNERVIIAKRNLMGPDLGTITGMENTVTYPQFFNLPNGDLLYLFREGGSGRGDVFLNRFDNQSRTWSNTHLNPSGSNHVSFLQGRGFAPDWNSYPNRMVLDENQRLHLSWTNRFGTNDSPAEQSGYQTNRHIFYAYSDDFGLSWNRMDGTAYELPIVDPEVTGQVNPDQIGEVIVSIPEGSSLINQTDMAFDHDNNPIIVTWYAPGAATGNHRRQYVAWFWDAVSGNWQSRQVSDRRRDPIGVVQNESVVRDLGRPFVLVDFDGRILVVYRDNQDANGISVVHTKPFNEDPERMEWFHIDLTFESMGGYEPNFDQGIWSSENKLNLLYQRQDGYGNKLQTSDVFVMQWDAYAYFNTKQEPAIYREDFSALAGDQLNDTAEDEQGEAWIANGFATQNGVIDGTIEGSAVLPFTPEAGQVYTLTMNVTNASNRWVALGFALASPMDVGGDSANDRFSNGNGISWMLYRQHLSNIEQDVHLFAGPGTDLQLLDSDFDYFANGSFTRELSVVLDTQSDDGTYTMDFLIDGQSVIVGPPVNSADAGLTIDDIRFVGFSFDDTTSDLVVVDNFSLIATEKTVVLGDVNLDGIVNLLDVAPFIALLSEGQFQAEADLNLDGMVNLLDVSPFIDLLSGG